MTWRHALATRVLFPTLGRVAASQHLSRLADASVKKYLEERRGFSYEFHKNGEASLIQACMQFAQSSRRNFVFFDVGANRGEWSQYVVRQAHEGPIEGHLFEISDRLIEILNERFKAQIGLRVNAAALSNENGTVPFNRFPEAEIVNTLLLQSAFWDGLEHVTESALATTGDEYCAMNAISEIDLLKIDVEGWEWNVLQGFDQMISNQQISVVQFEYGYMSADLGPLMRDFFRFFTARGYRVGPLRRWGVEFREFRYSDNDFTSGPNFVAALPETATSLSSF